VRSAKDWLESCNGSMLLQCCYISLQSAWLCFCEYAGYWACATKCMIHAEGVERTSWVKTYASHMPACKCKADVISVLSVSAAEVPLLFSFLCCGILNKRLLPHANSTHGSVLSFLFSLGSVKLGVLR
jgi:hypothetical protein